MECILEFSKARKIASGKLQAEATVIHRPSKLISGSGSIRALATIDINIGRTTVQNFGSQNEEVLYGANEPVYNATDSRNRLTCVGNFRVLTSKHLKLQNSTTTFPINTAEDIYNSVNSANARVVDVHNPYSDINPTIFANHENCDIKAFLILFSSSFQAKLRAVGNFKNTYVDKIGGSLSQILAIPNFRSTQKLYPIKDITTNISGVYFVDKELDSGNLYQSVDEGLFTGNYVENNNQSTRISDDANAFIQPSSIYSQGDFKYKCEVSAPLITPKNSFLFIRAAAPLITNESDVPSIYKIYNIKLEDPSGNLIVKYKDITLRGDGDFLDDDKHNFATYVTEPEINYASLYTWQPKFPILGESSGYTLNLDFNVDCINTPFSSHFSNRYENECVLEDKFVETSRNDYLAIDGAPIATQTQGYVLNPNNSLRISAIEIVNSGSIVGLLKDNYLPFHAEVQPTGNRLERTIYPSMVMHQDFDTTIEPEIHSLWKSSDELNNYYDNTSSSGISFLTGKLRDLFNFGYIELDSATSGKLQLQYKHEPPFGVKQQAGGAFNFGSKTRSKGLNSSSYDIVYANDSFFTIDSIELHILARKATGSPNYTIDVVGYSDDKVINVTSSRGGFLQNAAGGEGGLPLYSGFNPTDELALSAETLSDKDQYTEYSVANSGGDHFLLSNTPVVSSTDFQKYIVPLKIYEDPVVLGSSKDYSMSSYFETLYLDIYPLPSGAAISKANLVVKYKPSNALTLHTFGYQTDELAKRKVHIYPSPRKSVKDAPLNSNIDLAPLSLIEDIPHGFKYPTTLKTNYSRRWRGVDGKVYSGPFDPVSFDFAYYNPQLEQPFLSGYFDFNNFNNNSVISSLENNVSNLSGIFNSNLSESIIRNIGLRFNDDILFNSQERTYKTLDWTYSGHELYGQILDSFDNAVRISGASGNLNFGTIPTSSGFSLFTRFVPDYSISGVGYNLFNSGVIVSKWDSGNDLEFLLAYNNGHLCAYAKDADDNLIYIEDPSQYTEYQYPLSILLTYNDNGSKQLKLYTDNEIYSGNFNLLRDSSTPFDLIGSNSDLIIGHSYGSGVGINGFISEIGISLSNPSGTNIVESGADSRLQQTTAESFFSTHRSKFWNNEEIYSNDRYKLWDFVNENTDDWYIGGFKYCNFTSDFDILKERVGKDFIVHNFTTNGETYADLTNIATPTSINLSGIAYHSQVENDMLRFNLGGLENRFYSIAPRISKSFPRGYSFNEEGFVVDTVIQHETTNDIIWEDGKIGPKLIVSLYAKSKDSDLFDTTNWGLINRSIHHINPDICWAKISSKFTLADLVDKESEPWSNFITSRNITELNHKYFSKDINEMFLQYDLVYPSGSYSSKIKIHSSHVRLEDALLKSEINSTELKLAVSGEARPRETLALSMPNTFDSIDTMLDPNHGLTLYASGYLLVPNSGDMPLFTSGAYLLDNTVLPLHSVTVGYIGAPVFSDQFFGSQEEIFGSSPTYGPNLFVAGRTSKYDDTTLGLYVRNTQSNPSANETLILYTHTPPTKYTSSITLSVGGDYAISNFYLNVSAPLYVSAPSPDPKASAIAPLSIYASNPFQTFASGTMSLMVFNFSSINAGSNQLESFLWNKDNVGKDITIQDNYLAFLDANDEIRGVQTICYGECDNGGTCQELQIETHDTVWNETQCVDGGIVRALTVYNNPDVSGFKTPIGYSGHFYGIRKFDGLIPQAPYDITIVGKTGSDGIIDVPKEISEWEYGYNEDVGYSGIKIISPERLLNSNYGTSVAIKDDLMVIGSPHQNIYDENNYLLPDAGSVYVYRRSPEPSGGDWTEQLDKSPWSLENILTLPDGFKRDYYTTSRRIIGDSPFFGIQKEWYVGQEGRQLGHSLAISNLPTRKAIAVGAPSCAWSRTFEGIQPSSINVGLFVFTDEFSPTIPEGCDPLNSRLPCASYRDVLNAIKDRDILFKYFCDPPVSFNVTIIICEPILGTDNSPSPDFAEPKPNFIKKYQINRHQRYNRTATGFFPQNTQILNDIKEVFHEVFPYDETKLHNNIPPIVGLYVDNSFSLGERALQPALDQFINYYKEYSYASGLRDFDDNPASGYTVKSVSIEENWVDQSVSILNSTLSTGNMIQNNTFKLFANNLGTFNPNASDFNTPPSSGGRVYIYSPLANGGEWNIIQEIQSPTLSNSVPPDRFGHSLAFSDDGNVLVVGSPYIENAVSIYEYKPENLQRRYALFPSWLAYRASLESNDGYFNQLYNLYLSFISSPSFNFTNTQRIDFNKIVYESMTPSGQFEAMRSMNERYTSIQPYQLIKTLTYSDIKPVGSWEFFADAYAPTSRLGYSVACNEDGSLVAVGAPTDSMGAQDNINIWYKPNYSLSTQWQSYVNAGCVRLLESRNYYPHSKVVEYGKFGNLFELNSPEEDHPFFDHMDTIYSNNFNLNYEKTSFAEVDIPQDAGTLFIITPAVDAASDEIIEKIQNWLALGDRNLVLVGNDPKWEEDGLYAQSNQIINYILGRLDSRMRLHPARNRYESLIDKSEELNFNVGPSYKPQRTIETSIYRGSFNASGVADIRFHYPQANDSYSCSETFAGAFTTISSTDINNSCKLPIVHEGDLRASWYSVCFSDNGNPVIYEENIGFYLGTSEVPCDTVPPRNLPTATYEPIPLLAGIEKATKTVVHPAIPAKTQVINNSIELPTLFYTTEYPKFADIADSGLAFIWSNDSGNYIELNTNLGNNPHKSAFFDPPEYNDKNALLMSTAEVKIETVTKPKEVSDKYYYAAEEIYGDTTSKISLIAGTYSESRQNLLSSTGDRNLNFYFNLVAKDENGSSKIAQLGGWTNRFNFKDGDIDSDLYSKLQLLGNEIVTNVSSYDLSDISNDYNVAWIANTTEIPSDYDLERIAKWLKQGDKKLIITYGYNPNGNKDDQAYKIAAANAATYICEKLGLSMKPLFLLGKNRYARPEDTLNEYVWQSLGSFAINPDYDPIYRGTRFGMNPDSTISAYITGASNTNIIPINIANSTPLAYFYFKVYDDIFVEQGRPKLYTGVSKVTFPVIGGSGYQIHITSLSESPLETEPLALKISNCHVAPSFSPTLAGIPNVIYDVDINENTIPIETAPIGCSDVIRPSNYSGRPSTKSLNIQVPVSASSISIYINGYFQRSSTQDYGVTTVNPESIRTTRLLAISGSLLPIETRYSQVGERRFTNVVEYVEIPAVPSSTETVEYIREISTDSKKYCTSTFCENAFGANPPDIADGPVVAAQEIYHQRPFDAGVARSRITLLSDPSLIQGRSIADSNGQISIQVANFLGSLYPRTEFPTFNFGRQYSTLTKITNTEKLSPQKLVNAYHNSGLNIRFNASGDSNLLSSQFSDLDYAINTNNASFVYPYLPENAFPPTYTTKRESPITDSIAIRLARQAAIQSFGSQISQYGGAPKFSGVINGKMYSDASIYGGMPEIMKDTGHDYLDFDYLPSGYPGDLFGFSVAIKNNKVYVGAPFAAFSGENITRWNNVIANTPSGSTYNTEVGFNGGAGAVYVFEKNYKGSGVDNNQTPWGLTRKLRPEEINVGQNNNIFGDQFGYSISIDGDVLAIGAPGHDYENYTIDSQASFIRKEFSEQFDIQKRTIVNLGSQTNRDEYGSGTVVQNNGAVFTYENKIKDWGSKVQDWVPIHKLVPQGYLSRNEDDNFGKSIALDRTRRNDADYTLVVGAPRHNFGSGESQSELNNAGATYIYDAMLRRLRPSFAHPDSFIAGRVFGNVLASNEDPYSYFSFTNSGVYDHYFYFNDIIYANLKGEIFIEISGQDKIAKGFVTHRPFVSQLNGTYHFGTQSVQYGRLFIEGKPRESMSEMPLFNQSIDYGNVYNTIGLYGYGISDLNSGIIYLYNSGSYVDSIFDSGLTLYTESFESSPSIMTLSVRGK